MNTLDWTKPVRMNDGRKLRVICNDRIFYDLRFTHVILIQDATHGEVLAAVMTDGRLFPGSKDGGNMWVENVAEVE